MQKTGHPLRDIEGFSADLVARLRDELSVTTAEEFVDLERRYPEAIQTVVDAGPRTVRRLRHAASVAAPEAEQLSSEAAPDYPFATGQDAPPEGRQTFKR